MKHYCVVATYKLCVTIINGFPSYAGVIAISGGIVFTRDSDLSGPSPQFTLTCISTGGPATTVTWTRDSEEVEGEAETVLINSVRRKYDCVEQ